MDVAVVYFGIIMLLNYSEISSSYAAAVGIRVLLRA